MIKKNLMKLIKEIGGKFKVISKNRTLKRINLIIQIIAFPIIVAQLIFTCSQIGLMKDQINDFRYQEIDYKIASVKVVIDDIKYNDQKIDEMISANPFINKTLKMKYPDSFIEFDNSLNDEGWEELPVAALSLHKLNDKAYTSGRLFDFNLGMLYDTIAVYYNNMLLMNGIMEMAWNLLYKERNLPTNSKSLLTKKIMYHACYKLTPYLNTYSKLNDKMIIKLNMIIDNLEGTKHSKN